MSTFSTVTKLAVALDQLEWAIRLVVDDGSYIPAITLAGAAEEILGKYAQGRPAFDELRDSLARTHGLTPKAVAQDHLTVARNWFKHWHPSSPDSIELDLQTEAVLVIIRCLTNLLRHDMTQPSEGPRFIEWVAEHCPELWE